MQQKRFNQAVLAVFAALMLLSLNLLAQLTTGKVEGIVRDKDTGQPLAGAQVTVEGTRLGNVTNEDGYYFILNVPPGKQDITFTYTGYQKTTVTNTLVLAGQTTTVDAALSSTVVQLEGITIEGVSEILLPRDNTASKQRLTAEQLEETPATRLEDLLVLEAGVQIGGGGARSRGLRIRGGRLGEEGMVVDGVMVRNYTADPFVGLWDSPQVYGNPEEGSKSTDTTPLEFSSSAVEEVDIITGGFQAEYGNAQSGIINIVTKEGGNEYRGNIRYTTDQQNPRTSDWGYNQLMVSVGGPIPAVPHLYFHTSGEIQGIVDKFPTHASEGFRGVNQDFVNRLNDAVAIDPILSLPENAYTLEQLQTGRQFYAGKTGKRASLFSPSNPVRLPKNWSDRTLVTGKLTFSPIKGLKIIGTEHWSRNQNSYPNDWLGEGDYFKTGYVTKSDLPHRNWGTDTSAVIPQTKGRRVRASNLLGGFNWDFLQSAQRSASLQFRYTRFRTHEVPGSNLEVNYEHDDTFMGWSPHDIRFEVEQYPNRDNLHTLEEKRRYFPDGNTPWVETRDFEYPFLTRGALFYYLTYDYTREYQNNYKVDLDFQLNRWNRAKLGFQCSDFNIFKLDFNIYSFRVPETEFAHKPRMYAAYLQNRTDLGDFVIDYGLRFDSYQPRTNWGIYGTDQYGEDYHSRNIGSLSPRFDVGFPVTDKAQLRFSYGVFSQLPGLSQMLSRSNYGEVGYMRTDAFEAGISYLLSTDVVLDMVAYYRDIEGNLSRGAQFRAGGYGGGFRDYWRWHSEQRVRAWFGGFSNSDRGNIKGMDLILRKRFSNNFSMNASYTLQFSRTTGSAYNQAASADELLPIQGDRTHQFAGRINYMFPEDFKSGTLTGDILKNFRIYGILTFKSGQPGGPGIRNEFGRVNLGMAWDAPSMLLAHKGLFRGRWFYNVDMRLSKSFSLGKARRLQLFAEIFNVTSRKEAAPYPKGYTYEANSHVTGGLDWNWDDPGRHSRDDVRFNADFNGDGVLTVLESAQGNIAHNVMMQMMDKRQWGMGRQIRCGAEFSF